MSETISGTTLAARWAYSELTSPRFQHTYSFAASHPLRAKAKSGHPFSTLNAIEREELRRSLETHKDRGPNFYPLLVSFPSYRREEWEYSQLKNVRVVGGLGGGRFEDFANGMTGLSEGKDVRTKLAGTPEGPYMQTEPVIIVPLPDHGIQILLDGTFRSLLFARDGAASTKIAVWIPTDESKVP